jgi:hypothetical protein
MFEKIFSFPAVLRRHREGPLASERLEYLKYLNDPGLTLGTVCSGTLATACASPGRSSGGLEIIASMLSDSRPSPLLGQRNAWHRDEPLLLAVPRSSHLRLCPVASERLWALQSN